MILQKKFKKPINPITGWPRGEVAGVSVFNSTVKPVDTRPASFGVKHS
jgi:hypothetical protein